MKLLFDENISFRIIKKIQQLFPKSKHISSFDLISKPDLNIWLFAKKNNYTIVTNDSDFNELSLIKGFPPKVIWIKTGNTSTSFVYYLIEKNEETIRNFISDDSSGILIFEKE